MHKDLIPIPRRELHKISVMLKSYVRFLENEKPDADTEYLKETIDFIDLVLDDHKNGI